MNLNLLDHEISKTTSSKGLERSLQIKRIIEALLFSSSEPLSLHKLKEIVNSEITVKQDELIFLIRELQKCYREENKAFQIDEIGEGFLLRTCKELHPFIALLHSKRKKEKLGSAAMEVVAIIAYRSPITKSEIEQIRGVDCAGALQTLLDRELIEVVGYKESLGRARQFGVTKRFLMHFGLQSLREL